MASMLEWTWRLRDQVSKKLKGVQRASQRTEQGFNSMSKEARENMRKVQRSTGQLDQSIEDLENELKELRQAKRKAFSEEEIGRLNRRIEQTQGRLNKLNSKGLSGRGGLASGFSAASGSAGNLLGSVTSMVSPTQAAAAAATAVATAIGKAVTNTIKAANKMHDFRLEVKQTTGVSEEAAGRVATQAAAIGRTFDTSKDEVLKAANTISKQMGGSFQQAFRVLEQGFLSGGQHSEDFLDQVREYAPQFEKAGVSAQNMMGVFTRARRGGFFSDKLADSIKEAAITFGTETEKAKKALSTAFSQDFANNIVKQTQSGAISVSQALQKISQKAQGTLTFSEQETLVSEVFKSAGEDVGPKLLKVVGKMNQGMQGLVDKGDKQVQHKQQELSTQQKIAKAQDRLGKVTGPLADKMELMWLRAKLWFTQAIQPAVKWVQQLIKQFKTGEGALGQWGKWLKFIGTLLWESIQFSLKTVGVQLKIVWNVAKALTWPFRQLFSWIMSMVGGVEGVRKGFDRVQSTIAKAWRWVRALWSIISNKVWGVLKDIGAWLQQNFGGTLQWIGEQIMSWIVNPIKDFFGWLWDSLKSLGGGFLESMGIDLDKVDKRAKQMKQQENRISKEQADRFAGMLGRGGGRQGAPGGAGRRPGQLSSGVGGASAEGAMRSSSATGGGNTNINLKIDTLARISVINESGEELVTDAMVDRISEKLLRTINNSVGLAGR